MKHIILLRLDGILGMIRREKIVYLSLAVKARVDGNLHSERVILDDITKFSEMIASAERIREDLEIFLKQCEKVGMT